MQAEEKPLVVVVIDDDPDELTIFEHLFRRCPQTIHCLTFTNTDEALADLERYAVDAVLVDYSLGARTGLDLLPALQLASSDAAMILVTNQGDEQIAAEAMRAGFADYLPKQVISPKSLWRSISNAVEMLRLSRSVDQYRESLEQSVKDLNARNEEIQNFYHTLSHELKTPLTAAREFLAIVLDGLQGPLEPDQRESLQTAKDACDQIAVCMNDLLDTTRLDTGKLALQRLPVDVHALVERTIRHFETKAAEQEIDLVSSCPHDLPRIFADESRVMQVLQNLVSNALKFTDSGGSVQIDADPAPGEEDALRIRVRDTGRGIQQDQLERIFDRLHQAECDDMQRGLGLGLNLCRELVELHEGSISVESTVREGSTFTVLFPLHREPAALQGTGSRESS